MKWVGPKMRQWAATEATWAKEREARAKRKQRFEPIEKLGGHIYDGCAWVRGGVYVEFYYNDLRITDATLERLKGLVPVDGLGLSKCRVTDVGLEHLTSMRHLIVLHLDGTHITDVGIEHLKGLAQLEDLDLTDTKVTDAALDHLKGLRHLQWLALDGTHVTAEGVNKLRQALPNCTITWEPPTKDQRQSRAAPDQPGG